MTNNIKPNVQRKLALAALLKLTKQDFQLGVNYDMTDIYKLRDWIDINKIDWFDLSRNPNAIHLLEQNMNKIYWFLLSVNSNAIHLLEKNMDKIDWYDLSQNPNAIHLLEKNIYKINWDYLSRNPNIFTYDYNKMKKNRISSGIIEELIAKAFEPDRLSRMCKKYNLEFRELLIIY